MGRFVRCKYRNTDNNACPICYVPVAADAAASGTAAESPEKAPSLLGKGTLRERRGKFSKSVFADPPCIGGRGTKKHVIWRPATWGLLVMIYVNVTVVE